MLKQHLEHICKPTKVIHERVNAGEVMRFSSDISKVYRHLGWRSKVDINIGIRLTVDWFYAGCG